MAKHPKYINPATDFGFKKIFKDEEITRGFLNALMKKYNPEIYIAKVDITDGEADDSNKNSRRVVYDVHCVTDTEEEFIIEMQNDSQEFFAERIVYYLARSASRQQEKGLVEYTDENGEIKKKPWDYRLKNIYGVFFMNFEDTVHPQALSHFALMETTKHYKDSDVFQYWKIQMPFYRRMKESDCKNDLDKWIFNLSNMQEMETTLSFTNEIPLFMRLGKIASYSNLSTKQQIQYDDSYHNYMCYLGQMDYKLKQGIKIGKEEGRAEEKISMARIMKSSGEPVDKIVKYTGLTEEEINNL
jgi:hypothetical protein